MCKSGGLIVSFMSPLLPRLANTKGLSAYLVLCEDFPTRGEDEEERMDEGLREPCLNMAAYYTLVWNTIFHGSYLVLQYSSICTNFIPYVLVYSSST